jgi:hypothetical protein
MATQIRFSQISGSMPSSSGKGAEALSAVSESDHGSLAHTLQYMSNAIQRIHGATDWTNSAAGTFAQNLVPSADDSFDLGSASAAWQDLFLEGDVTLTDAGSVQTSAGILTVDGAGGIALVGNSAEIDITTSGAFDVNVGSVDLDSTAGIAIDGTTVSVDGTDDSNLTVTGSAKDLDIAVAGGGTQELRIASAGTGASALHLSTSTGGINIDSADMLDIDVADEITIDTTSADGHIAITSAHTAGDAIVISANADAGSILNVDAGIMDVDVQGAYSLDASGVSIDSDAASNLTTSAGDLDISSAAELDLDGATVKLDSAGQMDITAVAALNLVSAAYDVNASGVVGIDSDAAMTLGGSTIAATADGGALSLTTSDAAGDISLVSAHTAGVAIHLDGNAASGSIVDIDAGILDVDVAGAATIDAGSGLSLDAGAASNLTTSAGALTLDGAAGVSIAGNAAEVDITTSGAFDVNVGSVDLDSTAGIAVDGTTVSIDGTDDSNLTVTGSAKDLDIAVAGGGTQELRIASAGTGPSALHLNASGGGMNVDVADMLDIDVADEIIIDIISVDGHIAITSAHTAGDSIVISANADAGAILNIDAGIMDVDVQAGYTLDASGISLDSDAASNFSTSAGDIDISAAGALDMDAGAAVELNATTTVTVDGGSSSAMTLGASMGTLDLLRAGQMTTVKGTLNVDQAATFDANVTITGNLDVNGTTTTIDTTNMTIEDRIIGLGVSGSDGAYSGLETGILFARGTAGVDAQSALFYNGTRYQLGKSATSPSSSSFASVSSYEDLMLSKVEFDSANNHVEVNSGVLTMTAATSFEVASAGDVVFDIASGDVVIDSTTSKLEFGSAGSGEHITGDGTDLTVASGAKLNLTATSDVHIPQGVGLVFDTAGTEKIESDGTDLSFSVGSGGDINIPSNIGLVFGDDGEKIEGDGTDLTVSGNNIKLTAAADVVLPVSVGLVLDGSGDDKIESDGTDMTIAVGGGDLILGLNGSSEGALYPANDSQDTLGKDAGSSSISTGFHSNLLSGITLNSSMGANIVRFSPGGSLPSGVADILSGDTITVTDSNSTFTATASGAGSSTAAVLSSFGSSLLSVAYSGSSNSVLRVNSIGQFSGVAANDVIILSDGGSNVFTATVSSAAATDATLAQFLTFSSGQTITASTTSINVSSIPSGVAAQVKSGDSLTLIQGGVTATGTLSSDPSGSSYSFSSGFTLSGGSSVSTDSSFSTAAFKGAGIPVNSAFMSAGSSITPNGGSTTTITGKGIPLSGGTLSGEASSSDTFASGTATRSTAAKAWKNVYTDNVDLNGVGRIDLDADADTSVRSSSDDQIDFEIGGSDLYSMKAAGFQIVDDKKLMFGSASGGDASFEYDEDGNDVLLYAGANLRVSDDVKIEFGSGGDAGIEYDEDGTDQLRIHQPAAGVVIAGTNPKLVIGDAGAEDTMLVFDGNAQDYRMGLDDGTDKLEIGVGATHGTTTALTVDANQQVAVVATTAASSSTTGALVVAGGASVAADLYVGDDLRLSSDSAVLAFGDGNDVTFTHDGSNGLDVSAAGSLDLDSSAGSITMGAALTDGQTMKLGKNAAVEMVFTPHGTPASEKFSLTNTAGTAADAIALTSTAGGMTLSVADDKTVLVDQSIELANISEPSSPTRQLYSVSNTLYWNGAPLGTPSLYRHVLTASEVDDSGSGSSRYYAFNQVGDLEGDSDISFTSSTSVQKVHVYLNGQLQYINASGDLVLTSTARQLDFGATGKLVADDIIQAIVYG